MLTSVPVYSGEIDTLDLGIEEEVFVTIPRGQAETMTASVDVAELIQAPIQERQLMGTVNVMLEDEVIYSGEVVAMHSVAEGGMLKRFVDWISLMFTE